MSREKHRIALVGAGVIGQTHGKVIHALRDRLDLVAVVDLQIAKARTLTERHGGTAFSSLASALGEVDIDVVAVCTPTGAHGEVAIEALEAGKNVIIEKPAEITPAKIDKIIAAQKRVGRSVTVISQHRFDHATEVVLEAIASGQLGRVTSGIASIDWWRGQSYYDSGDWRGTWQLDGGGALMNQGVHTVDLLVAALGVPVEVFAYAGLLAHQHIDVEDVAVAVVRFASGALATIHASTAAFPGLSARLHVYGDRGSAVIDNDELAYIHLTPAGREREEIFLAGTDTRQTNQASSHVPTTPPVEEADVPVAHVRQYQNFIGALDGEGDIRVTLEQNRLSVAVICAVYESARTGRPVAI